jgi:hypothetical protein
MTHKKTFTFSMNEICKLHLYHVLTNRKVNPKQKYEVLEFGTALVP